MIRSTFVRPSTRRRYKFVRVSIVASSFPLTRSSPFRCIGTGPRPAPKDDDDDGGLLSNPHQSQRQPSKTSSIIPFLVRAVTRSEEFVVPVAYQGPHSLQHPPTPRCFQSTILLQHSTNRTFSATMCAVEPTSSSSASSAASKNNADLGRQALSHQKAPGAVGEPKASIHRPLVVRRQSSIREASLHATSGSLVSGAVFLFSIYFPFILAPWAASRTYTPAWYQYTVDSVFCNSAWTFGTDYFLAAVLASLQSMIPTSRPVSSAVAWRSRGLLASYCLSVLAGGLAHHFYVELPMRNTWHFRLLWTCCVGCVTFASAFMGSIGSELARVDESLKDVIAARIPVVPEPFWLAFGTFMTVVCAIGGISFQRPACDMYVSSAITFGPIIDLVSHLYASANFVTAS
jgi:hypothetical protein